MAISPRFTESVAARSSKSPHLSPRSSPRRIPVTAASQRAAKNRCPQAARRKACSVAAVGGVGAGGEDEPLARQPPAGKERPEGERASTVIRALAFTDQPGREPLGVRALAAGGVPAPSFSARDRVDAFVDDRVPAVALLRHVALHDTLLPGRCRSPPGRRFGRSATLAARGGGIARFVPPRSR